MRVLMCSNDNTFSPALSQSYARKGFQVVVGLQNFFLKLGEFDFIHFHWPEELVGFHGRAADEKNTNPVLEVIDWWRERSLLIATAHNIVPHTTDDLAGAESRYFRKFYEKMDIICHFSEYSRQRFQQVYPDIPAHKHVVHTINLYDHLKPLAKGRDFARRELQLAPDRKYFGLVGALRKYKESVLIREAWRAASKRDWTLICGAHLPWNGQKGIKGFVKKSIFDVRLAGKGVHLIPAPLNDPMLVRIVEASHSIIIARYGNHLNSGLLPLALTFGTGIVAPDYGIYREILSNTGNELYEPGNADDLARAMTDQAAKPESIVREVNLAACENFGWDRILQQIGAPVVGAGNSRFGSSRFSDTSW